MRKPPHILVVIQARMSSSRLPGKIMLPLAGRPLLQRVVERAQHAAVLHSTTIATSTATADDVIEQFAERIGVPCFRGDATDLLDRHYQAGLAMDAEVLVKIPSDCPLIDPKVIDGVIQFYLDRESEFDYVSNLHPESYPYGQDVEVVPMPTLEAAWREATQPEDREHTTRFITNRPWRFRIGNVLWEGGRDLSTAERWTVDYPEDYEFVRSVYEGLCIDENKIFGVEEVLLFLDSHPDIRSINRQHCGKKWYLPNGRAVPSHAQTGLKTRP
ncbi:MAG TPA: glycosyltransferase family protein [Bacteroidota bacterium]